MKGVIYSRNLSTAQHPLNLNLKLKTFKTERKIKMENYVRNEDLSVTITFTEEEFENRFCFCADCGELMFIDYAVRLNGEYFCDDCLTTCDCCGTVIRKNDVYTSCDAEDYNGLLFPHVNYVACSFEYTFHNHHRT